jgi:hypothetical protein
MKAMINHDLNKDNIMAVYNGNDCDVTHTCRGSVCRMAGGRNICSHEANKLYRGVRGLHDSISKYHIEL